MPVPREKVVELVLGHVCDAGEDVGEPGLWIDVVEPGSADQRVHERGTLAAAVGAGEQPCFSAERNTAQGAFGGVVGEADNGRAAG